MHRRGIRRSGVRDGNPARAGFRNRLHRSPSLPPTLVRRWCENPFSHPPWREYAGARILSRTPHGGNLSTLVRESFLAPTMAGILSRAGPHSRLMERERNPARHPCHRHWCDAGARILSRTPHGGNTLVRESFLAPPMTGIRWCENPFDTGARILSRTHYADAGARILSRTPHGGNRRWCENPFSHPPWRESSPAQDPIRASWSGKGIPRSCVRDGNLARAAILDRLGPYRTGCGRRSSARSRDAQSPGSQ